MDDEGTKVIDAMRVVRMLVREEHGVEAPHAGVEKLLPKVGRGIDQHGGRAAVAHALDQDRAAPAPVLGIARVAGTPAGTDARHAAGGAAAEDGDGQRHATAFASGTRSAIAALANSR
jgi:hypothetical protein